jgi:hypothetical protein
VALYTGVNPIYIEGRVGHFRSAMLTVLQVLEPFLDVSRFPTYCSST